MDDLLPTRVGMTGPQGAPSRGSAAPVDGGGFLSAFAPGPARPDARARERASDKDADASDGMASGQPGDAAWQGGPARGTSMVFKALVGQEAGAGSPSQDQADPADIDMFPWAGPASAPLSGPLPHSAAVADAGGSLIAPGPDTGRPGSAIQLRLTAADMTKAAASASDDAAPKTGAGWSPSAGGRLDLSAMVASATMHPHSGKIATAPVIDPAAALPALAGGPTSPASGQVIVPPPLEAGFAPDLEGAVTPSAPTFAAAAAPTLDLARTTLAEPLAVVTVPDAFADPSHDRLAGLESAGLGQTSVASSVALADRAALPQPAVPIPQQIVQALANPGRDPDVPLDLALDPPELGRVRLSFAEVNGILTLTISVERPETADLMRRHIALLNEEFARAGLDAPSVSISQGDTDDRPQSQAAAPMTEAALREDLPDEQVLPYPDHPRSGPLGGLDLRL